MNEPVQPSSLCFQTYTGRIIDLLNPDPAKLSIVDIAHALSNQCRYAGHCKRFFSEAEHSFNASSLCQGPAQLAALLHDAVSAYFMAFITMDNPNGNDVDTDALYSMWKHAILDRFSLEHPYHPSVMQACRACLHHEARILLPRPPEHFKPISPPSPLTIGGALGCWVPCIAEQKFLERFVEVAPDRVFEQSQEELKMRSAGVLHRRGKGARP